MIAQESTLQELKKILGDPNFNAISLKDSPNMDSFGRLRTSESIGLFDGQLTYDLQPLLFEQLTNGAGAAISHDTTNRNATLTLSATPTGGYSYMQTFEHFRYQPGKGQQIFISFNMNGGVSNVTKFAGYSDGTNGIEFQVVGSVNQFMLRSSTSSGNKTVVQADWNLDKLDGSGNSKIVFDNKKIQILIIDFQALYSGRIRIGFEINGNVIYAHEFLHANYIGYPYIQTANLPIRCGMSCTDTASTTVNFICSAVASESGNEDNYAYRLSTEGTATAISATRTHILSLQPRTSFNSITNRSKIKFEHLDIIVTGANPVYWELCVGQALTGTATANINATYSAMDSITGTLSGSPSIVIDSGYVAASAPSPSTMQHLLTNRYPITLNAAGSVRDLGRVTVLVTGIGGNSATRCSLTWKEIR